MAVKRQRGVKASRVKLEHFMSAAGIKSQAELARRMADIEGLESEPKDLVNRIFRQHKVEHHSLERVANALGVNAYELFLTQGEQAIISDNLKASTDKTTEEKAAVISPSQPPQSLSSATNFIFKPLTVLAIILFLGIAIWFYYDFTNSFSPDEKSNQLNNPITPKIEHSLIFPNHEDLYRLAQHISDDSLTKNIHPHRLGVVPKALLADFELSPQTLEKYEVDSILVMELIERGRYLALLVKRYTGSLTETIGVVNLSKTEFTQNYAYITQQINQFLTLKSKSLTDSDSQGQYRQLALNILNARALSEQFYDADRISQATDLLISLPYQTGASLAVQCAIRVDLGWHSNEKEQFEQAKRLCEQALVMDSQHPSVRTTNAFRLFRSGDLESAAREYQLILTENPDSVEALIGQAQLSMQYYLQNPSEHAPALEHAISLQQQAILQDPNYWKSYHFLSTFFYIAKQPKQALAVIERLTELVANEITLANGALLSLCQAELDDARRYSEKVLGINTNSYVAYETLFFINAYQNEPAKALAAMEQAMAHFGEQGGLYIQWGQLADAYRWAGDKPKAIEHYQTALVELEQDRTKNQTTSHDMVYSMYFQAAIYLLKNQLNNEDLVAELNKDRKSVV